MVFYISTQGIVIHMTNNKENDFDSNENGILTLQQNMLLVPNLVMYFNVIFFQFRIVA